MFTASIGQYLLVINNVEGDMTKYFGPAGEEMFSSCMSCSQRAVYGSSFFRSAETAPKPKTVRQSLTQGPNVWFCSALVSKNYDGAAGGNAGGWVTDG